MKQVVFIFSIAIFFAMSGCKITPSSITPEVPAPSFIITYQGLNPDREARGKKKMYQEKIIDTHVHLYPPARSIFDKGYGKKQHVIEFPPNFEPFLKILDIIAEKELWVDLHVEPVTKEGVSYEDKAFGGLEVILKRNPDLRLIYSHTAMTNSSNVRQILERFPQVLMNIKLEHKHDRWGHLGPVVNPNKEIYEDWAQLFEEMPERFMVGTDFHFGRRGVQIKKYSKRIKQFRYMLGSINAKAARLIAYENARHLIDKAKNKLFDGSPGKE